MGKGKKPGDDAAGEHISRPLATLKDPSSFGPPPKNVNYHGGAALPNEITPHRGGIGAPLSQEQIASAHRSTHAPPPEEVAVKTGPPLPYRANTTGLSTSHLPPPPVHRNIISPPPQEDAEPSAPKPKPGLPPRLPSRQNTADVTAAVTPPPPSYDAVASEAPAKASTFSTLNSSAVSNLSRAGVKVPAFGIGRTNSSNASTPTADNPWSSEPAKTASPGVGTSTNTMSELQSRFSRMNSKSNANVNAQDQTNQQTAPPTIQQTQSAFTTAQNLRRDPSSVSMNDARSAATTANTAARSASDFRQKHATQIAAAENRAKAVNNKYQLQSRFERFLDKHAPLDEDESQQQQQQQQQGQTHGQQGQAQTGATISQQQNQSPVNNALHHNPWQQQQQQQNSPQQQQQPTSPSPELAASISRKPPPPPPPKKPAGMHSNSVVAPPPVPLGTKPGHA
jgi:hypothetical protein